MKRTFLFHRGTVDELWEQAVPKIRSDLTTQCVSVLLYFCYLFEGFFQVKEKSIPIH